MSKKQTENRYTPASYKQGAANTSLGTSILTKKVWTIVAICLALIVAVTGSLIYALYEPEIPSQITTDSVTAPTSDLTIPNANFKLVYADGQNIQYPRSANNWSLNLSAEKQLISTGVLDVSDWENVKADLDAKGISVGLTNPYYPAYSSSTGFDKDLSNIYMITKKQEADGTAVNITSEGFSLAQGSYTKISVWIKSSAVSGEGLFVALTTSSSPSTEAQYKVCYYIPSRPEAQPVTENNGWQEYSFYIEGNKSSSETLYLQLGLGKSTAGKTAGASGTVLFAGIEVKSISRGLYNTHIQELSDQTKNYMSYSFDDDAAEKTLMDWSNDTNKQVATETYNTITYAEYRDMVEAATGSDDVMPFDGDDTQTMYKISSDGLKTIKFARFNVDPPSINKSYRLSLWVRTDAVTKNSGIYIYLNAYDNAGVLSKTNSAYFSLVQTDDDVVNSTDNGWSEYNFYIQASETDIYSFELEVTLGLRGGQENYLNVSGSAYLTEILLHQIDHTDYNSATAGDKVKKIALTSSVDTESLISNGSFTNVKPSAPGIEFPLAPTGWTEMYAGQRSIVENYDASKIAPNVSSDFSDDYSSIGGMIYKKMQSSILNAYTIAESDFYYADDSAASVLMIYNKVATAHGYTSSVITLAKNTYYRISVLAKGIGTAVPSIYLTNGGLEVYASFEGQNDGTYCAEEYKNIDENIDGSGYSRYYFYIATGETEQKVYLELWLGLRASTSVETGYQLGTVLFDQAECLALADTEDTENGESQEYLDLFEGETPAASTTADITKIYTDKQAVTSSIQNLKVIDYRYNDVSETKDLQRVLDFAKTQTEITTELTAMIDLYNTKHYEDATEGKYFVVKEDNMDTIKGLKVYLNSLITGVTDDDDTIDDTTETEPVDWLVVSSLFVTVAMLAAIIAIIFRKFVKIRKKTSEIENNYVG